jgi:hypothetical protein
MRGPRRPLRIHTGHLRDLTGLDLKVSDVVSAMPRATRDIGTEQEVVSTEHDSEAAPGAKARLHGKSDILVPDRGWEKGLETSAPAPPKLAPGSCREPC